MKFTASVAFIASLSTSLVVALPGGYPHETTCTETITTTTTVTAPGPTTTVSTGDSSSHCNTGPIQCCNSVEHASSHSANNLLGLLGVVLDDLNVLVGITCSPITAIGLGGSGCSAHPVCCENNTFNGLINIGCVPINIGL